MNDKQTGATLRREPIAAASLRPVRARLRLRSRVVAVVLASEVLVALWCVLVLASRAIAAAGLDGTASSGVLSRTGVIVTTIILAGALASTAEMLWSGRLRRTPVAIHAIRTWAAALVVAAHTITAFGALTRDSWLVALVAATVAAGVVLAWSAQPSTRT